MACSLLLMLLGARSAVAAACPTTARVPKDTSRLFLSLAAAAGAGGAAQSAQPACATSHMACHNISNSQGKNPRIFALGTFRAGCKTAKGPKNPKRPLVYLVLCPVFGCRHLPWTSLAPFCDCAASAVACSCCWAWRPCAAPLTPVLLSAEMPIRTPATWPLVWPYQQHGATSSTEVDGKPLLEQCPALLCGPSSCPTHWSFRQTSRQREIRPASLSQHFCACTTTSRASMMACWDTFSF